MTIATINFLPGLFKVLIIDKATKNLVYATVLPAQNKSEAATIALLEYKRSF